MTATNAQRALEHIHLREVEAVKLARAHRGMDFPSQEDRVVADAIVKAGLTLTRR